MEPVASLPQNKDIKKAKIAYKTGFSSALSIDSYSAYNDLYKWSSLMKFGRREVKMFLLGWEEGYAASWEFKKVFGGKKPVSDVAAVATLR